MYIYICTSITGYFTASSAHRNGGNSGDATAHRKKRVDTLDVKCNLVHIMMYMAHIYLRVGMLQGAPSLRAAETMKMSYFEECALLALGKEPR